MNAETVFAQGAGILSAESAAEFVKGEYHKLQTAIFSTTPTECFLKMWNVLDLSMVFMLSPRMMERGVVSQKDICALCSAESCPFNKVSLKNLRIIKVKILGRIYNQ